jgi:catechol-2,3-dioxygenase
MRHLAFRVDRPNFLRAQAELRGRGISFTFEDHQIAHSIYLNDPDGYEIELTTYELDAAT